MQDDVDLLVVGAGFSGSVLAERCASQLGWKVLLVEKRHHIGGNAYDETDAHGVRIHTYGPHWFHTNSERIVEYLSQFTEWHKVDYRVLSHTDGRHFKFPINLDTFNAVYGTDCSSEEMELRLAKMRVPITSPANSEEVIISQVGWDLYRKFYHGYTRKQWQCEPRDLDASVCGRIPVRTNRDDRYFTDNFQALPREGYHALFQKLTAHPNIQILLNIDYLHMLPTIRARRLVYTGPVDAFFHHRYGKLPYRSLRFERENKPVEYFQPAMQVNFPNDHEYTRIVEAKHATGQKCASTTIVREFPASSGEPYYPIPTPANRALYEKYESLCASLEPQGVHFIGRLATYRYYNMDQVIGMALTEFEKLAPLPLREHESFARFIPQGRSL